MPVLRSRSDSRLILYHRLCERHKGVINFQNICLLKRTEIDILSQSCFVFSLAKYSVFISTTWKLETDTGITELIE